MASYLRGGSNRLQRSPRESEAKQDCRRASQSKKRISNSRCRAGDSKNRANRPSLETALVENLVEMKRQLTARKTRAATDCPELLLSIQARRASNTERANKGERIRGQTPKAFGV